MSLLLNLYHFTYLFPGALVLLWGGVVLEVCIMVIFFNSFHWYLVF